MLLGAILATAIQLPRLVRMLVRGPCKEVDGALSAFMENALGGDTTCFRLAVRIRPGMVFLAFVAVLHMIFGALAAVWKSTSVSGAPDNSSLSYFSAMTCGRAGSVERRGTGIATLSSRRRVDGVEVDVKRRHKISTQAKTSRGERCPARPPRPQA